MFKHILVPTDGSRASERAVTTAIRLGKAHDARVTFMHVISAAPKTDFLDAINLYPDLYPASPLGREAEKQSKALLEKVAAKARAAGVQAAALTDKSGRPWRAIVRHAKTRGCDLVIMASHGRRGLEAVLLGSETTKVLTHSKVPVLVCR